MPTTTTQHQAKIDALMEQASKALVERRYFDCERHCAEALRKSHAIRDYERMARICLPLQEARRQIREIALDAGEVFVVRGELPSTRALVAGCYLVCPPRVGVDGRAIREAAERKKTAVMVVVREPATREGEWPIVAVGPVTVRTKVKAPPQMIGPQYEWQPASKATRRPGTPDHPEPATGPADGVPTREWFVMACEALGDAAIASVSETAGCETRLDALVARLEAVPNHEKLHQRVMEAAEIAAKEPPASRRAIDPLDLEDDAEEDDDEP